MSNTQDTGGVVPQQPGQTVVHNGFTYTQKAPAPIPQPASQTGQTAEAGAAAPTPTAEKLYADKFKSAEELESGYKNLESKLGELGTKAKEAEQFKSSAEKFNKLVNAIATEQGITIDAVLKGLESKGITEPTKVDETVVLKQKVAELEFFDSHADLKGTDSADLLRSIAKSQYDGNLNEAINSDLFKKFSAMEIELKKLKEGTSVVESNPKLAPDGGDYTEQFKRAQGTGNWSEVLRMKGLLPKK